MQNVVSEHEQYLDAMRDFNDWLISAKEELQRWSDLSGDSLSIKRKLSKVQVRKNVILREKYLKEVSSMAPHRGSDLRGSLKK